MHHDSFTCKRDLPITIILTGHPLGNGRWPHNRGCTLKIIGVCLPSVEYFQQVNFSVNMEGLRGNHFFKEGIMIKVFLNVFITGHVLFRTLICHCLFQNKLR